MARSGWVDDVPAAVVPSADLRVCRAPALAVPAMHPHTISSSARARPILLLHAGAAGGVQEGGQRVRNAAPPAARRGAGGHARPKHTRSSIIQVGGRGGGWPRGRAERLGGPHSLRWESGCGDCAGVTRVGRALALLCEHPGGVGGGGGGERDEARRRRRHKTSRAASAQRARHVSPHPACARPAPPNLRLESSSRPALGPRNVRARACGHQRRDARETPWQHQRVGALGGLIGARRRWLYSCRGLARGAKGQAAPGPPPPRTPHLPLPPQRELCAARSRRLQV